MRKSGVLSLLVLCASVLAADESVGAGPAQVGPAVMPGSYPKSLHPGAYQAPAPAHLKAPAIQSVAGVVQPTAPILSLVAREPFPNASFETTRVAGWTAQLVGPAQPVGDGARKHAERASESSDRIRIAGQLPAQLGGDYWKVPFPTEKAAIGQRGAFWLEAAGLVSTPTFALQSGEQFVSFLFMHKNAADVFIVGADGAKLVTKSIAPSGAVMHPVIVDLASVPAEKRGALRVQIAMTPGSAIDDFLIWRREPAASALMGPVGAQAPGGIWGIADLHAHLFNHIGFGGRMFAGSIHSSIDHNGLKPGISPRTHQPYANSPSFMDEALPRCHDNHGSAPDGQGVLTVIMEGGHNQGGYPTFTGWPRYSSLSHQQAYVDWLKRAWRGGLRLVQVDVGNSQILAELFQLSMSWIPGFGKNWNPASDSWAIDAELKAMHDFVQLPDVRDWIEIAQGPADVRRIVGQGKMAFVLGLEVDDMGNLSSALRGRPATEQRRLIRAYLDALHARGVRHLIPIHTMENGFGAPAVYEPLFDVENRIMNGHLFPIRDAFSSGIRTQLDIAVTDLLGSNAILNWIAHVIDGSDIDKLEALSRIHGHAHQNGLDQAGKILVQEAMRRGIIVDLDHMSDLSASDTLAIAERIHYPLVSSHTGFRELAYGSWKRAGNGWTPNTDIPYSHLNSPLLGADTMELMAKERDRSPAHLARIRALGGMVGIGAGAGNIPVTYPLGNTASPQNCDGSSTVFAQELRYANEKMGGRGIAVGTDINGFNGMANPRFGPYACFAASGDPIRATGLRGQANAQQHPVRYVPHSPQNPMGIRTFTETRFLQQNGAYKDYEEAVTWEALARFKAGAGNASWGPAAVSSIWEGHDYNRDVTRMAYGFWLAANGASRQSCPNCGIGDTHPDVDSAWDVWHGRAPRADYAGVKTIFEAWRKLETTGTNEPLEKNTAGDADFDINLDGFAHYGLLPDFLQDAKNVGVTPNDMAPLFRSAEDYAVMWETIEAQREAAIAMPDL
jgi:microsomal dipeptidase-like Zn-dependent dipeptidase